MSTAQLNLTQTLTALSSGEYPAQWAQNIAMLNNRGLSITEFAAEVERVTDGYVTPTFSKSGNILGYNVKGYPSVTTPAVGTNSNAAIVARGEITAPVSTTTGTGSAAVQASRLSGVGSKIATGASKIALPVALASVGITLGKTIDETLYNANPNFWNDIGLETLNPQTWSSIAGGDDTLGGSFINALFGIDPNTGETQPYIDANALAYLAYCMSEAGIFDNEGVVTPFQDSGSIILTSVGSLSAAVNQLVSLCPFPIIEFANESVQTSFNSFVSTYENYPAVAQQPNYDGSYTNGLTIHILKDVNINDEVSLGSKIHSVTVMSCSVTANANTGVLRIRSVDIKSRSLSIYVTTGYGRIPNQNVNQISTLNLEMGSAITGIGDQTGATIPDFDGLSESDFLPYLQQTYPDMFNDAINYPVVQPDGTVTNYQYVPITLPNTSNPTDTQPTSGNQSQAQPSIDPSTATDTLTDLLVKLLQQPMDQPITDTPTPPTNPTDTGEGSSPVPVAPIGSASSLWKIYHPTQGQVDSFGAWLWSPDFIDQVLKIFNNPMESIIGLHKVYATPIDAGTSTIHVGYLDSEVPSAYIEQQYIDVDCGSVNLYEQFGNALDYIATDVKLYLPFVGIVPLDVNEVMRATINVSYGVDVLTGACLARVQVSRDGNSAIIYQYAGNCAVQYPISSGSYMGIVSSILGIAGSVAATVATGGGVAPLAIGAASAAMGAHTSVQNSGNFSGNAGAMGGKIPYLIVERAQSSLANDFPAFKGYPANDSVRIGDCSGFVRGKVSHIVGINATDTELDEIADYIANGILV